MTARRAGTAVAAVALAATACTSGATPTSSKTIAPYTGPVLHGAATPLGVKWDWTRLTAFSPYLRQLSGGSTFFEAVWCDLEPDPGHWRWRQLDSVVSSTRRLGMTLMLKLRTGTCWATNGRGGHFRGHKSASAPPADPAAYRRFVDAVVSRYAPLGVHEYAIENEVNGPAMWVGTATEYEQLARVAAAAIHASDPKAVVADAGISSTAYGAGIAARLLATGDVAGAVRAWDAYYAERTTRRRDFPVVRDEAQLRAALASPQPARDVTFLRADQDLLAHHVVDVRQIHFYEDPSSIPALLAYLHATTPPGTPIEAWETGLFSLRQRASTADATAAMVKTVCQLLAGGVRRVIWLPLAYDPTGRHANEPRYGLLDPNGARRGTGTAFLTLAHLARHPVTAVHGAGFTGAAFSAGSHTTLVVWATGTAPASVPVTPDTTTTGVDGSAAPAGATVSVGQTPVEISARLSLPGALRAFHATPGAAR